MIHTYSVANDTLNGKVDTYKLEKDVQASSITKALDYITVSGDTLTVAFKAAISTAEKTTLDGVVSAHTGDPVVETDSVEVQSAPAFAAKTLPDGRKLFRRVHGVKKTLSGDTKFELVIPYNQCKVNAMEIVWAPEGLQADLKVYDTPTGAITATLAATNYTAIPNFMLNQFGFDAGVAKDFYEEASQYDADLIKDMKLEATLKNPGNSTKEVCVNFILHEIKPAGS